MKSYRVICLILACVIGFQVEPVRGQMTRPDPDPIPPPPVVEKPPKGFLEAYRALGSPRLLIYAYMLTMDNTNELGTLKAFEGRLRPYFIHPDVTIAFQNASQFHDQREFAELAAKNSIEAAKLVSRESPADYVILVSFIPQGGREGNVKYTQTYEILDMKRGTMVGTHSWEMSPGQDNQDGVVDVRRLEKYAQALAVKITDDFMNIEPPPGTGGRFFTLRIAGLRDARLAQLRSLLLKVKGVKNVIRPIQDAKGAQFDVKFSGDALDFAEVVREAVEAGLNMNASFLLTDEGMVVVEVWPRPIQQPGEPLQPSRVQEDCDAALNGDPENQENQGLRSLFLELYKNENEPKIGIMINKEASKEDAKEATKSEASSTAPSGTGGIGSHNQSGQNTVICIQCPTGDSGPKHSPTAKKDDRLPTDDDYLNAREMEDRLFRRFGSLKMERVDLKVAFNNLRAKQKLTKEVYDEGELARIMGEESQAGVVIAGAGKVVHSQSNVDVRYTFRAYEMGSARILAAIAVNRTFNARVSDINEATESMAAEAVGNLSCQIRDVWLRPHQMNAEITGARSVTDVLEAMRAIQRVPGVKGAIFKRFNAGSKEPGKGSFEIKYSIKCEDLISGIAHIEKAPFQLDSKITDCQTLTLKAIDK